VADKPPESLAPFTLRLVRSSDVLAHFEGLMASAPIAWLQTRARSITNLAAERYEIVTDAGTLRARWVFDSATDVPPKFPSQRGPYALESGMGIRVEAATGQSSIRLPQPSSTRWMKAPSPTCCR